MIVVDAKRTPIEQADAAFELLEAFPNVDRETAAMLLSLVWIETAQGRSVIQHNPGNLTASDRYPGLAWRPPWFEVDESDEPRMHRLHQLMLEGKAPKAFRAYRTLKDGFADFVRLLSTRPYAPLLSEARTGDVSRFRAELARRYSADYTPAHDRALTQFRDAFRPFVAEQPAPDVSAPPAPPPLLASNGSPLGNPLILYMLLRMLG